MKRLLPEEIAVDSYESASIIANELLKNGYVVMLSQEESLYIVSYIWTEENYSERNDVVFMSRSDFEEEYISIRDDECDDGEEDDEDDEDESIVWETSDGFAFDGKTAGRKH